MLRARHDSNAGVVNMLDNPVYTVIGFIVTWWIIIVLIWKVLRCVRVHLLPELTRNKIDLVKKYGAWAGNFIRLLNL